MPKFNSHFNFKGCTFISLITFPYSRIMLVWKSSKEYISSQMWPCKPLAPKLMVCVFLSPWGPDEQYHCNL